MMPLIKKFEHLKIELEAITSATNNFSDDNCIGKGGFGKVYKGELLHSRGHTIVAIKRLDRTFGQGNPEFWKEIIMLSQYKHENIVSLLGFCDESNEKILVYEYSSKGSLDMYLNDNDLTWIQRLKICIQAACGLAYLHNPGETQQRVLHRDIKSSNILLDENWNARISDLGLSKLGPANQQYTFLVSNTVGTFGYCDPLYMDTGLLTKESDVYSFGVVLFEILCGRLSIIGNKDDTRRPLIGLVRRAYISKKINELVFGNMQGEINPKSLEAFTDIAYQCLKKYPEERPLMTKVVSVLEDALECQLGTLRDGSDQLKFNPLNNLHRLRGTLPPGAFLEIALDKKMSLNIRSNKTQSRNIPKMIYSCYQIKVERLPDLNPITGSKVMQLIYTNYGLGLLALASSGTHKIWKMRLMWIATNEAAMFNHLNKSKAEPAEESAACIALSKNDSFVMSASGGKVSMFNMMTSKVVTTFMPPPPAATYLAFHPQDDNIVAIGKEDSKIQIFNVHHGETVITLQGHQKRITGLAFSMALNLLVSSGSDAQLCMWNINGWEMLKSRSLQSPPGYPSSLVGDTKVQYHNDQRHLLIVHESLIAIFDPQLECLKLWAPRESLRAPISSAIYSCDCLLIFTGFSSGAIGVFDAESLSLRYRIAPSAYISPIIFSSGNTPYPSVIAAHSCNPNQFALGMSGGSVHVIELADTVPKLGASASQESSTLASSSRSDDVRQKSNNPILRIMRIIQSLKVLKSLDSSKSGFEPKRCWSTY